jgi:hypothetical protein
MASLFSALLPEHLKEKLGMRAKERDKVKSVIRKPLATANTTPARLSTDLRSQVIVKYINLIYQFYICIIKHSI